MLSRIRKGIYRHYKGKRYRVFGIARHSETPGNWSYIVHCIIQKNSEKNALWVRPKKLFWQKARVNGKWAPRFKFLSK